MKLVRANESLRSLWMFGLMGAIVLLFIALNLWHRRTGLGAWDYFKWSVDAVLVVFIWLGYRRDLQDLDRLADQIRDKALVRLSGSSTAMVLLAYLFLLQALANMPR
jgi:hypothetical protein